MKTKKYIKDVPKLVSEYHFEKNADVDFEKLTHGSNKKVWWKCSHGHKWQAKAKDRHRGNGCPYCSNHKACIENCLAKTHPELASQWSLKNKIKTTEITYGSGLKVWWKCSNNHEWKACVLSRSNGGHGCPYCSGHKACKGNCLKDTHPELLGEWDFDKNRIKPTEITFGSTKRIWWKCKKGHEWKASILSREKGGNCPYCSNYRACKDNCLSTTHPHLLKEWNNNKNIIKPEEVVAGSKKKVWWKCKKCNWEWESRISHRTRESGCPRCKESRGESKVEKILEDLKIRHKREYKFKKLGRKKFDFALFKKYGRKPYAIIEYHGEQHYIPVRFGGMSLAKAKDNLVSCQKRDKIKRQYCLDNYIKYLEIPYTKKDNIEKLIKDFL